MPDRDIDLAEMLVIPDLADDPRTAANPLVTGEPAFRFYAGAPLVLRSGIVVGRLCVIDTVARPEGLTPEQTTLLRALARAHQYRARRADGNYYWIKANGRVDHGPDGSATSFPGVLIDVEERRAVARSPHSATSTTRSSSGWSSVRQT